MSSELGAKLESRTSLKPKRKLLPLSDLPLGCAGVIAAVDEYVVELMDLGFIPGVHVTPTYCGPGGDPRVYEVDGTPVAIRGASARHVCVNFCVAHSEVGD